MAKLQEVKDVFDRFIDYLVTMYVEGGDGDEAATAAINDLKDKGMNEESIYESLEVIGNFGIAIMNNDAGHAMVALAMIEEAKDKVMDEVYNILNSKTTGGAA